LKKDRRISSIQRGDTVERGFYIALVLVMIALLIMEWSGVDTGYYMVCVLIVIAGIRMRCELRDIRLDAIRRENVARAEREGLAMPRLYEDIEDLREAVHNMRFKKGPPS
jgi:hypothetical protein